MQLISSANC